MKHMNKFIFTGLLINSSFLSANTQKSIDFISNLSTQELTSQYLRMKSGSVGKTSTITIENFNYTPFRMKFFVYNGLPRMENQIYVKRLSCEYEYVDNLGFPDGYGSSVKSFRTWPGEEAVLVSDKKKCTQAFTCKYTLGVDGDSFERTFDPIRVDIVDAGQDGCIEYGRIKLVAN